MAICGMNHRDCLHPATKSARAACRKARAKAAEAAAQVYEACAYLPPTLDPSIPQLEKVNLVRNPFDYREDFARYAAFDSYLDNASLPDSAFWVDPMTATDLIAAATTWAEDEAAPGQGI